MSSQIEKLTEIDFWKKEFEFLGDVLFQRLYNQAVACNRISLAGLRETLVYSGKGIRAEAAPSDTKIHAIVEHFLGRTDRVEAGSFTKEIVEAVFFKKNSGFLSCMRDELRGVLRACVKYLPPKNEAEEKLLESFVGNIVALIPYSYPEEGEKFLIPMKIKGEWKFVSYTVDRKIKLGSEYFTKSITAYGLISPEGPPLLSFLGTTFPAGEGFFSTVLADFTPCMSVGHAAYLFGKKQINDWMQHKRDVQLYGVSLGGALCFQTLCHHREKIAQVYAYNPPGLYSWDWGKNSFDSDAKVNIYYQDNDLVATMGAFPTGKNVTVYRMMGLKTENFAKAHVRVYTGGEKVTLLKSDPLYENGRLERKILTILHFFTGMILLVPVILAVISVFLAVRKTIANSIR